MSLDNAGEILTKGGGVLLLLMTLVQISPIKVNPWSWLATMFGRAINSDVMKELAEIKKQQAKTEQRLEEHITSDDYRAIDAKRRAILHFNNEVCRGEKHTKEGFIEILKDIDDYESYCRDHPEYPNTRAVCAIENIKLTYKEVLRRGTFLQEGRLEKEEESGHADQ